jgi:hypothetical protein
VVFSTEFYLPAPIEGPFLALRLISTSPLMLYLAGGETMLMLMRLFLWELPKEKPLDGRRVWKLLLLIMWSLGL